MLLKSYYTGGNSGWGNMITVCAECGAILMEQTCDEDGIPVEVLYDYTKDHECED